MDKIKSIKEIHNKELEKHCQKLEIDPESIRKLLDAEKSKKLFKRNVVMQQQIDNEIDKSLKS